MSITAKVWISFFCWEKELIIVFFFTKELLLYFEVYEKKSEQTKLFIIPKNLIIKKREKRKGVCITFIVFMINLTNLKINYQRLSFSWTC